MFSGLGRWKLNLLSPRQATTAVYPQVVCFYYWFFEIEILCIACQSWNSLCRPGVGLEIRLPASASRASRVLAWATMPPPKKNPEILRVSSWEGYGRWDRPPGLGCPTSAEDLEKACVKGRSSVSPVFSHPRGPCLPHNPSPLHPVPCLPMRADLE